MPAGRLFLVPAWLSEDTPPADAVPAAVLERVRALDCFVVEDAKSARRFLAACAHPKPLREIEVRELNDRLLAALAYVDMTLMCVKCHQHVRDVRIGRGE